MCVFAYSSSDFRLTPFKYFVLLCTNMVSQLDTIKKRETCLLPVPHLGGLRIAYFFRTDNAKPTPNINILRAIFLVKVRVCAYVYTQKTYQNRHKRDNLYPVGHLSLLSPEKSLKFAKFQGVRTERNKRLFNMSAKPSADAQTSLRWISRCKGNTFF